MNRIQTQFHFLAVSLIVACVSSAEFAQAQMLPTIQLDEANVPAAIRDDSGQVYRLQRDKLNKEGDKYKVPLVIEKPKTPEPPAKDFAYSKTEWELEIRPAKAVVRTEVTDTNVMATELLVQPDFTDQTIEVTVVATFEFKKGAVVKNVERRSNTFRFYLDSISPAPKTPVVERSPSGAAVLRIKFEQDDLDPKTVTPAFKIERVINDSVNSNVKFQIFTDGHPKYDRAKSTVSLNFRNLDPGNYIITMTGLKDVVGNTLIEKNSKPEDNKSYVTTFTVLGGRQFGKHVEYPRFLPPGGEKRLFNPGDRVDSRVVRLYYMRDARRVAELINRNVRNLNQTGYDAAQRFAQDAREEAKKQIDGRREFEALAVQAAQNTRATQRALERARKELEAALREQEQVTSEDELIGKQLEPLANTTDTKLKELQQKLQLLQASKKRALARISNQVSTLEDQLETLSSRIQEHQQAEIQSRNRVLKAEAGELRASQEQFRREVAAGLAPLDTYAAGKIDSVDPVTQVTISVVGTSRLQLRGPIKGINKIRRMIHQLDSPVGQVKIGIHTIQVNGEHGDRMDVVYERINAEIAHSRFLVSQSGMLFRKAIAQVASACASAIDKGYVPEGCPLEFAIGDDQASRDWRYVYAFFGADFIGELRRMDSELLNTENKMLSLHSMDTISLAGAQYVTALADSDIRCMIVQRFRDLIANELPEREIEYVKALTRVHTRFGKIRNLSFRKQLKLDAKAAERIYFNNERTVRFPNTITFFNDKLVSQGTLNPVQYATIRMAQTLKAQLVAELEFKNFVLERSLLEVDEGEIDEEFRKSFNETRAKVRDAKAARDAVSIAVKPIATALKSVAANLMINLPRSQKQELRNIARTFESEPADGDFLPAFFRAVLKHADLADEDRFSENVANDVVKQLGIGNIARSIIFIVVRRYGQQALVKLAEDWYLKDLEYRKQKIALVNAEKELKLRKERLFSKRLLEQFMDEQEEKSVELLEALRAHASNVDNYLKRLAIAVEDDVNAQFYEPAFQRIRRVSRSWDVTLGQIETTTLLMNNRTLGKVSPSATFEFDLPHRDILLTEALNGSKALATEFGNLLQDSTFLAGASMLAGQPATGLVGSTSPIQGIPGVQNQSNRQFGAELQKLIPDPQIYKFETGTGFEIRPVIQPDGHSIIYTFDYMYTTNIREPVRADEKHLGRVKRHYVHTDVQTSSFELREVSRYTVALKASRTARGVPLFEDIPLVGALFRPLPSQESSLQTNIILASSVIYPTTFDLMGLRWSLYVDDVGSIKLVEEKKKQTDRRHELRQHLLMRTREDVNQAIGLPNPQTTPVQNVAPGFKP